MRFRCVHLWWIIPLILLTALAAAGWQVLDSLHYGNATPLHRAVMKRDLDRVKRLISRQADVNARMKAALSPDLWGVTPLHLAARNNSDAIIDELLRAGADKDAVDELGFTPLHAALNAAADAAAQSLIHAGAQVHSPTGSGRAAVAIENNGQPIRTALEHANIETVRAMLAAGADPQSDIGEDAMAFAYAPDLVQKLQLLLDRGFSVKGESPWGRPLHTAAANNDAAAISLLLDHGAKIESRGGYDAFTPLLAAAYAGSDDAVRVLIQRGANPKAHTDNFGSPLYAAAFSGNRETVRLLLSFNLGIEIQAGRKSDGATPLHFAYWNNDTEMADLLLKAGASPTARTSDGRLPREYRK